MITPKRPYLIRAFHEWMQDNDYTPYLMIDATHNDLHAPLQYAQDGRLVLAVSYQATHNLQIDNDAISFAAPIWRCVGRSLDSDGCRDGDLRQRRS